MHKTTPVLIIAFCVCGVPLAGQEGLPLRPAPGSSYQVFAEDGTTSGPSLPHAFGAAEVSPAPMGQAVPVPMGEPAAAACHGHQGCYGGRQCYCPNGVPRIARTWHCHMKPWLRATHWGYPEYFVPEPLGMLVHEHFNTQVGNGQAAQLVLYRCDFVSAEGATASYLNFHGHQRLRKMVHLLSTTALPLLIEGVSDNPQLNEARKIQVLANLARLSVDTMDSERIIVVDPCGPRLEGFEAAKHYEGFLKHTEPGNKDHPEPVLPPSTGGFRVN